MLLLQVGFRIVANQLLLQPHDHEDHTSAGIVSGRGTGGAVWIAYRTLHAIHENTGRGKTNLLEKKQKRISVWGFSFYLLICVWFF